MKPSAKLAKNGFGFRPQLKPGEDRAPKSPRHAQPLPSPARQYFLLVRIAVRALTSEHFMALHDARFRLRRGRKIVWRHSLIKDAHDSVNMSFVDVNYTSSQMTSACAVHLEMFPRPLAEFSSHIVVNQSSSHMAAHYLS